MQRLLKQKLVCALPHARFSAIKHSAHHVCGIVWIETAALVETGIANYFGTLPYCSCDSDTRRVVINALGKTVLILLVLAESVAPQAAETCDRDQHLALRTFQSPILAALRVQLFLQRVDVLHQFLIRPVGVDNNTRIAVSVCFLCKCI